MMYDNEPAKIVAKVKNLPLLSENAAKIISLLDSFENKFEDIVNELSPEVTARFLSMANSAHYGIEVKSITHALRVLGFNAMRQSLVTSLLLNLSVDSCKPT